MQNTPSTGPGKILVVEPDPAVALYIEVVLGVWEAFEVTSVPDCGRAADLIQREPWDLILADFQLPQSSRLQVLAAARDGAPAVPVAMMTTPPVMEPAAAALQAADGFVTKPVRPADLIGLATNVIERSRQAHEQAGR